MAGEGDVTMDVTMDVTLTVTNGVTNHLTFVRRLPAVPGLFKPER